MYLQKKNIRKNFPLRTLCSAMAFFCVSHAHAVCFVKADAAGRNDGSAWSDAYTSLQSALADSSCGEIWVAKGVYKPSSVGDPAEHFNINPGITLYGGFGGTETRREQRDYSTNVSILSGDIDDNDTHATDTHINTSYADIRGNNSYNVVFMDGSAGAPLLNNTVVDGFTITGGNAVGVGDLYGNGAAIVCNASPSGECSPSLQNLVMTGNSALYNGGAFFVFAYGGGTNANIRNVSVIGNWAGDGGAFGIQASASMSNVLIEHSSFQSNATVGDGGALSVEASDAALSIAIRNCEFSENSSGLGGAIGLRTEYGNTRLQIDDSSFIRNAATGEGGALWLSADDDGVIAMGLNNSTLFDNNAQGGGAAYIESFSITPDAKINMDVNNVTFTGNSALGDVYGFGGGGAIMLEVFPELPPDAVKLNIRNSILWGDVDLGSGTANEIAADNAAVYVAYSDLSGGCLVGFACSSLIDANPKLGALGYYFGSTSVVRPGFGSPVIDAADDATCESIDQRGVIRPQGAHCDMGAVELRYPSDDIAYPTGF